MSWRAAQARPSVGFDLQGPWGSFDEALCFARREMGKNQEGAWKLERHWRFEISSFPLEEKGLALWAAQRESAIQGKWPAEAA